MRSKKKIGLSALGGVLLAVTAFSAYRTYDAYAEIQVESNLLLENIEALAEEGNEGPNCHNVNGYRTWRTEKYFWEKEQEFYDCCYELQKGYNPSGTCS